MRRLQHQERMVEEMYCVIGTAAIMQAKSKATCKCEVRNRSMSVLKSFDAPVPSSKLHQRRIGRYLADSSNLVNDRFDRDNKFHGACQNNPQMTNHTL